MTGVQRAGAMRDTKVGSQMGIMFGQCSGDSYMRGGGVEGTVQECVNLSTGSECKYPAGVHAVLS